MERKKIEQEGREDWFWFRVFIAVVLALFFFAGMFFGYVFLSTN